MSKVELIRKGKTIFFANDDGTKSRAAFGEYKSISQAKRASREWQKANGGLGIGKLRVER